MPKEIIIAVIGSTILAEEEVRKQLEKGRWELIHGVTFGGAHTERSYKQEFHQNGVDYVAVGGPNEVTIVFTVARLDALAINHARSQGLRIVDQNGKGVESSVAPFGGGTTTLGAQRRHHLSRSRATRRTNEMCIA